MTKKEILCFAVMFLCLFSYWTFLIGSEKKIEVEAMGKTWEKFTVVSNRNKHHAVCCKCNQTATYIYISQTKNQRFCEDHKPKETPILVCPEEWGLPDIKK